MINVEIGVGSLTVVGMGDYTTVLMCKIMFGRPRENRIHRLSKKNKKK